MIKKLKNYLSSEFVKNAGKIMTGTVLSQAIPIFAAPVLARLYAPADYGLLGLYMSVTSLISIFSTLQYTNAIIVATNDDEARSIMNLCIRLTTLFSALTLLLSFALHNIIAVLFKSDMLKYWLLAAPFSIFMGGLTGIFSNYALRTKQFGLVSRNRVYSTIGSTAVSLTVGFLTHHVVGLFAGLWVNQFINGLLLCTQSLKSTGDSWKTILSSGYAEVKNKYINFPKYSLPSDFLNNFTNQIPVFMLNSFGSLGAIGSFNMSNRILGLPITFISSAFSEVFRQKAAEDYNTTGSCREIFMKTFKTLSLSSVLPFVVLAAFGPQIFSFVLGAKWVEAGRFAQIMSLMYFFRFTISPLTYVYFVANKLKEDMILHIVFLLVSILSFYLGYKLTNSIYYTLLFYAIGYSFIYVIYFVRSYKYCKNPGYVV